MKMTDLSHFSLLFRQGAQLMAFRALFAGGFVEGPEDALSST